MRKFLLILILALSLAGCGNNKAEDENISIAKTERESDLIIEENITLAFGYQEDDDLGFGDIIDIN